METLAPGIAVAFLAGLLSFLSPCVLPLVPSYISFVTGVGLEDLEEGEAAVRRTALIHSLLFVLGFSIMFMMLGISFTALGRLLFENQIWIARIGGGIVILFGLHLLGVTPLRFLNRERRVHLQNKPIGYLGTVLVGITFAAGWTPCIGPILGGILTYAGTRQDVFDGLRLLGAYSLGLAVPFVLAAVALSRFLGAYRKFRRYIPWVERASGILLIVVGLLLVSGRFTALAGAAARLTPQFILERI